MQQTDTTACDEVQDAVVSKLKSVPEVQALFTERRGREFHVWTVVTKSDPTIRRKVYSKEKEIIDQFDSFLFDFNIVESRGVDPRSVLDERSLELSFSRT